MTMSSPPTQAPTRPPKNTVLVTGAGGYIGFAVSRAFARAGWDVYGLIRRAGGAADALLAEEITPIVGAISADLGFLDDFFLAQPPSSTRAFDVVVSCTEQIPFDEHWGHVNALLTKVAHHAKQNGGGKKPLVLMSSGCKDYGQTRRHGEPGLAAHTETSPLEPVEVLAARTACTLQVFEQPNRDLYDAAVVRPTPLFEYGGSYYGVLFEALGRFRDQGGAEEGGGGEAVRVPGHDDNIYHGCHVDDCADAYVALATHPSRAQVSGECFNVSGYRYETVGEVLSALAAEYGIRGGIATAPLAEVAAVRPELRALEAVLGYTQWVDSTKIRKLTGWTDRRRLFSENTRAYRLAYEAAARAGDAGVARIRDRVAGWAEAGLSFERK
ncbi:NAD(P)-binding protein [Xylaria acuta]|nr:NAD(P)-binding protein [Xylaria acuta]